MIPFILALEESILYKPNTYLTSGDGADNG
jgi:hypothetical protein